MKKATKIYVAIAALALIGIGAIADSVHEGLMQPNGNGNAMKMNLNEPNNIVPAKNNYQSYERIKNSVSQPVPTFHPWESLSNTYNNKRYMK